MFDFKRQAESLARQHGVRHSLLFQSCIPNPLGKAMGECSQGKYPWISFDPREVLRLRARERTALILHEFAHALTPNSDDCAGEVEGGGHGTAWAMTALRIGMTPDEIVEHQQNLPRATCTEEQ